MVTMLGICVLVLLTVTVTVGRGVDCGLSLSPSKDPAPDRFQQLLHRGVQIVYMDLKFSNPTDGTGAQEGGLPFSRQQEDSFAPDVFVFVRGTGRSILRMPFDAGLLSLGMIGVRQEHMSVLVDPGSRVCLEGVSWGEYTDQVFRFLARVVQGASNLTFSGTEAGSTGGTGDLFCRAAYTFRYPPYGRHGIGYKCCFPGEEGRVLCNTAYSDGWQLVWWGPLAFLGWLYILGAVWLVRAWRAARGRKGVVLRLRLAEVALARALAARAARERLPGVRAGAGKLRAAGDVVRNDTAARAARRKLDTMGGGENIAALTSTVQAIKAELDTRLDSALRDYTSVISGTERISLTEKLTLLDMLGFSEPAQLTMYRITKLLTTLLMFIVYYALLGYFIYGHYQNKFLYHYTRDSLDMYVNCFSHIGWMFGKESYWITQYGKFEMVLTLSLPVCVTYVYLSQSLRKPAGTVGTSVPEDTANPQTPGTTATSETTVSTTPEVNKPESETGKPETESVKPECEKPETETDKPECKNPETDKPEAEKTETETDKPETETKIPETLTDKAEIVVLMEADEDENLQDNKCGNRRERRHKHKKHKKKKVRNKENQGLNYNDEIVVNRDKTTESDIMECKNNNNTDEEKASLKPEEENNHIFVDIKEDNSQLSHDQNSNQNNNKEKGDTKAITSTSTCCGTPACSGTPVCCGTPGYPVCCVRLVNSPGGRILAGILGTVSVLYILLVLGPLLAYITFFLSVALFSNVDTVAPWLLPLGMCAVYLGKVFQPALHICEVIRDMLFHSVRKLGARRLLSRDKVTGSVTIPRDLFTSFYETMGRDHVWRSVTNCVSMLGMTYLLVIVTLSLQYPILIQSASMTGQLSLQILFILPLVHRLGSQAGPDPARLTFLRLAVKRHVREYIRRTDAGGGEDGGGETGGGDGAAETKDGEEEDDDDIDDDDFLTVTKSADTNTKAAMPGMSLR